MLQHLIFLNKSQIQNVMIMLRMMFCFQCPQETVQNLVFPDTFNKPLINCEKIASCLMQYSKNMGNDQKPRCLCSIKLKTTISKFSLILLHGYHSPKLKNIAIFAIAFLLHNFKTLPTCHMVFFWVSNQTYIFFGDKQKLSVSHKYYFQ